MMEVEQIRRQGLAWSVGSSSNHAKEVDPVGKN